MDSFDYKDFSSNDILIFFNEFCLLVTVAFDIFIKEKINTLYLPWISPFSIEKVSTRTNYAERYPIKHLPTPRIFQVQILTFVIRFSVISYAAF